MRRLSILFSLVLFFGCGTRGGLIKPGFEHFRIYIEQDGTVKDIDSGEVSLDKKPFVIIVTFIGPDSIFVNASFTDESYIPARDAGLPVQQPAAKARVAAVRRGTHSDRARRGLPLYTAGRIAVISLFP